ncbi:hypothetical protein ROS62_25805 [Streptomyces sp. DSM 41972]|uniref:Lipoprotein n=1 Tax=Streptomyces althioticus subsp. attaecolombicae TaxID=3075534 RepID=A0ABU3I581_9ACTN|nr:hypothetical protein [Streptomyces sp. DSM 41972]SCD81428.1 hypothetical protein GA0115238_126418 [Streptomyces sp. di50b]SCE14899.1 hypothetical protein GA0115245_123318 [Streptomyces sp. di188]
MRRFSVVAAGAAVTLVGGLAVGGCVAENGGSAPAPDKGTASAEQQQAEEGGEEPQGGRSEAAGGERDDLVSFEIDDRSQAGFDNVWVTWTIRNRSSEKSDYTWDWEAVGPDGKRLYNSTEWVTDVQPGQTATGESPTTLKTPGVTINITEFNRSKSW